MKLYDTITQFQYATTHPAKADTSGIAAFRKTYPGKKIGAGMVLCATETCYPLTEHDVAMPWDAMA